MVEAGDDAPEFTAPLANGVLVSEANEGSSRTK
jgi:hypothetical protein